MNVSVIWLLLTSAGVIYFASRRWALLVIIIGLLFTTQGQYIQVLGINIFPGRILETAGFIRVMVRQEFTFRGLNKIDKSMYILYLFTVVVYLIRSKDPQAYQIGLTVDAILAYSVFRGLIGDIDDLKWFLRIFVFSLLPYTVLVFAEMLTGQNAFAFMGGIIEHSLGRGGRPRCWGSFAHPILLGSFGASFLPLYIAYWLANRKNVLAIGGVGLCLGIVFCSNSGGPLAAVIVCLMGWLFWPMKQMMWWVRCGIVGMLVALAVVMKAPIWYVFDRVSRITAGEGWHRSYLIEVAMTNIEKWWLAGMALSETHQWFPYSSPLLEGSDITNLYIAFGLSAGLGAIGLLVMVLMSAFSHIGKALAIHRELSGKPDEDEFMLWGLGVMLMVHMINWFGVTYFDQQNIVWFMHIAAISSITKKYFLMEQEEGPHVRSSSAIL